MKKIMDMYLLQLIFTGRDEMILTDENAQNVIKDIQKAKYISLDFETLSIKDKTIVSFSFAFDDKVYFAPVRMKYFFNISEETMMNILTAIAENHNIIFHHFAFDGLVLHKVGIHLKEAPHDTLLISHLLDENGSHKLKDLVKQHFSYEMQTYKSLCGTGKKQIKFSDVSDKEKAQLYGEDDAKWTLRLFEKLYMKLIKNDNLRKAYSTIERPLLLVVNDMHIQGIPVNGEKIEAIQEECIRQAEFYKSKLDYYMPDVNLHSPKQLREYFIDKKRCRAVRFSKKTQAPSVDSEVLKKYAAEGVNEADWILKYRFYTKVASTFTPALLPDESGKIHSHFHQVGTTSGRFSSSNPNCLSLDTEILTPNGWKKHNDLFIGDSVYQWGNGAVTLTKVLNKYLGVQKGIRYNNRHIDICASLNHRQVFKDRKTGEYKVKEMKNFMKDALILHGGKLRCSNYNKEVMKFNVAVQADGYITKKYIDFGFTKKRKGERLVNILNALGIKYEDRSTSNRFRYIVYGKEYLIYLTPDKEFSDECIQLGEDFIEELFYWDGLFTRKNNYASAREHNVDIVQAAAALTGKYRTHKRVYVSAHGSISYQLDFTRKNYSGTAFSDNKSIGKLTPISNLNVWAISVPLSFIIVRRNGKVFVTGNCQNLPRSKDDNLGIRECICAPTGYKLVGFDYSAIELRLIAHFSNEQALIDAFKKGEDMHQKVADTVGCSRNQAKTLSYALLYGAGINVVAKNMGTDRATASQYMANFRVSYPNILTFIAKIKQEVIDNGKVVMLYGRERHLPTYFEDLSEWEKGGMLRSIVNAVIQGSSAMMMKKAMVDIYKELEGRNAYLIGTIHDELLCITKESEANDVVEVMKRCMVNAGVGLLVPIVVDGGIGDNWQEIH
jgi:DNA polymerase I-like protein with 3'-5' exonuclease and polymerase domains